MLHSCKLNYATYICRFGSENGSSSRDLNLACQCAPPQSPFSVASLSFSLFLSCAGVVILPLLGTMCHVNGLDLHQIKIRQVASVFEVFLALCLLFFDLCASNDLWKSRANLLYLHCFFGGNESPIFVVGLLPQLVRLQHSPKVAQPK